MGKSTNYSKIKILLILCLSFALLLAQTNNVHMHVEHDGHASEHVVDVHIASLAHDIDLANHHDNHHYAAIDISFENVIKQTKSLNPLLLVFLVLGFFVTQPRLGFKIWHRPVARLFTSRYYLLQPPLRAPPSI